MNRLRHLLKPLVALGTLVSCLLSFFTPSFAISMVGYSANAGVGVLLPEGIVVGPTTTFTLGNAFADVFVDPSFNALGLRAGADDLIIGTSASKAALGFASAAGALTGPGQVDLPFIFTWVTAATFLPQDFTPPGERATAHAAARFSIQVDGVEVAGDVQSLTVSQPGEHIFLDPPPTFDTVSLTLGPGLHPVLVTAQADGFLTLSPVPEPTTLLLVGTTAAGLGLARWRQRRRKQP
jgi:hypothetical protein